MVIIMFIDERGNLQFDSLEEMRANKELAIKEINDWVIPSIEEIEKQTVESMNEALSIFSSYGINNAFGESAEDSLNSLIYIIKLGLEMATDIVDKELNDDNVSLKFNSYVNRTYMALDNIKKKVLN